MLEAGWHRLGIEGLGGGVPTFQDHFQLVPQDVEDAIAGVGLRDDVASQPASASILVEVLAWLLGRVHVLEHPGSCGSGRGGWRMGPEPREIRWTQVRPAPSVLCP